MANDVLTTRWAPDDAEAFGRGVGAAVAGRVRGAVAREAARGAVQQGQLARLREGVTVPVVELPHLTSPAVEPADVERLADLLADV